MTAIFQTNQPTTGKTSIRFTYSADTARLQTIIGNFAEHLHSLGQGPRVPFSQLTNQQKLDIIDGYLSGILTGGARHQRQKVAEQVVLAAPEQDRFD